VLFFFFFFSRREHCIGTLHWGGIVGFHIRPHMGIVGATKEFVSPFDKNFSGL